MNDKKEELQIKTIGFRRDDFDEYKKLKEKGYFNLSFASYCKSAFAEKFQKDKISFDILKNE